MAFILLDFRRLLLHRFSPSYALVCLVSQDKEVEIGRVEGALLVHQSSDGRGGGGGGGCFWYIGHLLPDALVFLVFRDIGVEMSLGKGGGACAR